VAIAQKKVPRKVPKPPLNLSLGYCHLWNLVVGKPAGR